MLISAPAADDPCEASRGPGTAGPAATVRPAAVCHLIDANADTAYFRAIAGRQDRSRYAVRIGSLQRAGALQDAMRQLATPTFSLDATRRSQYGAAAWRLARLLRRERASILHAHCFDPTAVGLLAARLAGVRFVFTRHHSDHNLRLGKRWHTRVDAFCGRAADAVIAVSEATRRVMVEREGVPADGISVVYNGMEAPPLPSAERVERIARQLGLAGQSVCLMVARLHEEKGHRVLFEALPSVAAPAGPLRVLLAGDGPERQSLEQEARRRGLDRTVTFLGRRDDVPDLLAASSMLVLPSLAESFGFAALEAMGAGRPVVAARTGGLPELVVEGVTGVLVTPGDPADLARAMSRLFQEPALGHRLGAGGQRRAQEFTAERMVRGYERVYDRLLP